MESRMAPRVDTRELSRKAGLRKGGHLSKQATAFARKKQRNMRKPLQREAQTYKSRILLVGRPDRIEVVRSTLKKIKATIDEVSDIDGITSRINENTLAVILASPVPGHSILTMLSRIRRRPDGEQVEIFALVDDGLSGAEARLLYNEGATAVFEWPQEGLVFSRLVVELLAVDLVHGTMTAPDSALARAIRAHMKLFWGYDNRLRLRVEDGVAFMSGSVAHLGQKERIEELVSNILGVRSVVVRRLLVEPSNHTDAQIKRGVLRLLRNASNVDETTVAVNVERGCVTLAGSVTGRRELNRARRLLANVDGVRRIERLTVISPSQKQRDHVVAQRLRTTLSNLFPDQKVNAAFFGGVAVLSGMVGRLRTSLDIQLVFEDDDAVQRVVNKIEVRSTCRQVGPGSTEIVNPSVKSPS
jgi:hypothetical protein